jgi:FeS assembly protein IscX
MEWDDVDQICRALCQRQPPVDSRAMSDAEIVALVTQLPGFTGDRKSFHAGHVEAIRAGVWWGP